MAQYIDKSALVAEIEKRRSKNARNKLNLAASFEDNYLLSFLDTLETKEVDLKKDFELTWEDVAWIVNKTILQCRVESTLTAEDICKDVLKQFKAQKGE